MNGPAKVKRREVGGMWGRRGGRLEMIEVLEEEGTVCQLLKSIKLELAYWLRSPDDCDVRITD